MIINLWESVAVAGGRIALLRRITVLRRVALLRRIAVLRRVTTLRGITALRRIALLGRIALLRRVTALRGVGALRGLSLRRRLRHGVRKANETGWRLCFRFQGIFRYLSGQQRRAYTCGGCVPIYSSTRVSPLGCYTPLFLNRFVIKY